ncbi:unnamed protein product [Dicrocoelium dendriticum]|nr:unnamed protein product [Dicrocoelium dendriticum]
MQEAFPLNVQVLLPLNAKCFVYDKSNYLDIHPLPIGFQMIEYPSGTNHPISTSQNFTFTYAKEENEYPQLVKVWVEDKKSELSSIVDMPSI